MTVFVLMCLTVAVAKLWLRVGGLEQQLSTLGAGNALVAATPDDLADDVRSHWAHWAPWQKDHGDEVPRTIDAGVQTQHDDVAEQSPASSWSDKQEDYPESPPCSHGLGFEELFGRLLPVWAGGVTLAVAGVLIVKFSIDRGLLSPLVRFISGLIFGSALIGGAEIALRLEARVRDARVRQALAGAGIATFYAAVLVAANLYHLITPATAFIGAALITAAAGGLSLRFGASCALLGMLGGLAAPALVGSSTPNVPLLVAYLALAIGGLCTLSRTQRWVWLGVGALVGGFGWGAVLVLGGALDAAASVSIGMYMLLLGIGLPLFAFRGSLGSPLRMAASLGACAEIAVLLASGGFVPLDWGLFGMISIALLWLSTRDPKLRHLPSAGMTVALLLVAVWPHPGTQMLAAVLAGIAAIYGMPSAWRVWRERGSFAEAGQVSAIAVAVYLLPQLHFILTDRDGTLLALLGAACTGLVAALGRTSPSRRTDARFAILTTTGAVLIAIAGATSLPAWLIAPWIALVAAGQILLAGAAQDSRVEGSAWAMGAAALATLAIAPPGELGRAFNIGAGGGSGEAALRWLIPALAAALFAIRGTVPRAAWIGQSAAVVLAVVAASQLMPAPLGSLVPAILLAALAVGRRTFPGAVAAGAIAIGWTAAPMAQWLDTVVPALAGDPAWVTTLPALDDVALRLALPAIALAFAAVRRLAGALKISAAAVVAAIATAALHIGFKHVFAIHDPSSFVRFGLAERTVWEGILAAAALSLRHHAPRLSLGLLTAAFAHLLWFSLLLHDPLWVEQAVGLWPIANLLLPLYGLAFALLWLARRLQMSAQLERMRHIAQMLCVLLFAASELRQLFHGSILLGGGVGQGEDIARSALLIALALGFLGYGMVRSLRGWRIASLLLMLAAVGKVFLLDAAGLDGLLRIASFAALGFSLIGIGWLYQRTLPGDGLTSNQAIADTAAEGGA